MKLRPTTREIPDRPHYVTTEANGRTWTFRLPVERRRVKLVGWVGGFSREKFETGEEALDLGFKQQAAIGAIVGRLWFDAEYDLETVEGADLLAFGEAVGDELYEEGHDLATVSRLGKFLMERMQASLVGPGAVKNTADFSERPAPAGTGGSASTSP